MEKGTGPRLGTGRSTPPGEFALAPDGTHAYLSCPQGGTIEILNLKVKKANGTNQQEQISGVLLTRSPSRLVGVLSLFLPGVCSPCLYR